MKEIEIGRKFRDEMKNVAEKFGVDIFPPWKIPDSPWKERNQNPCDRIMGLDGRGYMIEMKRLIRNTEMKPDFARVKMIEMLREGQLKSLRKWASTGNQSLVILGQLQKHQTHQFLSVLHILSIKPDGEEYLGGIPWGDPVGRKRILSEIFFGQGG